MGRGRNLSVARDVRAMAIQNSAAALQSNVGSVPSLMRPRVAFPKVASVQIVVGHMWQAIKDVL